MALFGFGKKEETEVLVNKKAKWDERSSKIKTWMFIIAIVAEIAIVSGIAKSYGLLGEGVPLGAKVAVIDFNQEVTQEYVKTVIQSLDDVKTKKEYKEVLFIMNSPGGSPTASEELSEYLKDYTKEKKVHMYVQDIAASGGYYIASAIKPLIANKNAMIGSIGVIMPHYNIGPLAKKLGVEEDDLSSGEYKKPVSFFKKVGEKEKAYLKKQLLTPTYNNFIDSVSTNRGIERAQLLPYTEGKIFVANAKEIRGILVDEVLVLHRLKERIRKGLKKKVSFVDVMPKEPMSFLGNKVDVNLNLDTKFDSRLR